ncbi:MAG: glycoside hydrolase family 25 protein [Bacteroidales bacterium]|nr:glycoside hydrolase family 25 protein [Bacteroidales bacterium]
MAKSKRKTKKRKSKLFNFLIFVIVIAIIGFIALEFYNKQRVFINNKLANNQFESYVSHFSNYSVFGIDVSEYQKSINWRLLSEEKSLKFIFIRASAGNNRIDKNFTTNWHAAQQNNIIRGAYHYYRPDENSATQALNFINTVNLNSGDLPPVLDIEAYSKVQSTNSLKTGLLNWLKIVEEHYNITPIIYTFPNMYKAVFKNDKRFNKYPIWIAYLNLSDDAASFVENWSFRQVSHVGIINGIDAEVDINIFNGNFEDLEKILIK